MKLYLGGSLAFHVPEKKSNLYVHLSNQTLLTEVIDQLRIPIAEVHLTILNGDLVEINNLFVCDSDEVRLFPPVGGG